MDFKVKSVDGVPVEELNKPTEELAPEQQEAMKGPQAPADEVIKVDLSNPPKQETDAVQESEAEEVPVQSEASPSEEVGEEVRDGDAQESDSPLELISEEKTPEVDEKAETNEAGVVQQHEAATPPQEQKEVLPQVEALPEGIDKLVKFMEETGGTVEDFVNLNKNLDDYSENDLLFEYYKQTTGWEGDEIREHINDSFSFDEEIDDPKDVRKIKREYKAELRNAKKYLQNNRDQYYADLKLRPRQDVDPAYQEAYDFHTSYKESQQASQQLQQTFAERTDAVFNELKGFDFKVGDNTYRYKVNEPAKVKQAQSDINNFVKQFLGEDGTIKDAEGYHKALFTARNADKMAQHFYEQGRADALKQSAAEAKNISMDARATHDTSSSDKAGPKVKVVNSEGFGNKLRMRNYRNR